MRLRLGGGRGGGGRERQRSKKVSLLLVPDLKLAGKVKLDLTGL